MPQVSNHALKAAASSALLKPKTDAAAFDPAPIGVRVEMVDSVSCVIASPKIGVC